MDSKVASCKVISGGNAANVRSLMGAACDKMRLPATGAESENRTKKHSLIRIDLGGIDEIH